MVIETDTEWSATYDFLLVTVGGLSCIVSEINGDFGRTSQNFQPRAFNASVEGVPLDIL